MMPTADREKVRRVLLCTGQGVLHAAGGAGEKGDCDTARSCAWSSFIRCPRPKFAAAVANYPRVEEIGWVQEEPENRGGWTFMEPRLRAMFPDTLLAYYGRDRSASPAVGSMKKHQAEEKEFVAAALGVRPSSVPVAKGTPATAVTQTATSQ